MASNSGPGMQVNIAPVSTRHSTSLDDALRRGLATRTEYVNVLIEADCSTHIPRVSVSGKIRPVIRGGLRWIAGPS